MDVAVALVRDGVGVGLGDDGEGVEDFEGVVFGGTEHLELVVEDAAEQAAGLFHAPFGVHGEGVLEVHHLGELEPSDERHGADHLVVYDVGLDFLSEVLDGAAGAGGVPVAHLEGFGAEVVAGGIEPGREARGGDDGDGAAIRLEGGALPGGDFVVGDGKEVYLMATGKFHYLVIGAELVTFFERIGESGKDD